MKTRTSVHRRHTVKWKRHNTLDETAGNTRELGLSVQPSVTDGKHVRRWTSMGYKDRRLCVGGDRAGRQCERQGGLKEVCTAREKKHKQVQEIQTKIMFKIRHLQRKYMVPGRGLNCPSPKTSVWWSPNPYHLRMWTYWRWGLLKNETTGWALIHCDYCLLKKGRWGQTWAEGRPCEGTERWPSANQEERSEAISPANIFILDF